MKKVILVILSFIYTSIFSQDIKQTLDILKETKQPKEIKSDSRLYKLGNLVKQHGVLKSQSFIPKSSRTNKNEKIKVMIIMTSEKGVTEQTIDTVYLKQLGLEILESHKKEALCLIDISQVLDISTELKDGYLVVTPPEVLTSAIPPEGPQLTNSTSYKDGGKRGLGVTIAIIDNGFMGLSTAIAGGFCKNPGYMYKNNSSVASTGTFESGDDTSHGRLVYETIYAHAPDATYELYSLNGTSTIVSSLNKIDTRNVDIISMSLVSLDGYWNMSEAFEEAIPTDALMFVAAGNFAKGHQLRPCIIEEGTFLINGPQDIYNRFSVNPGNTVKLSLKWSDYDYPRSAYRQGYEDEDLDLYLYKLNSNTGTRAEIDRSSSPNFYEYLEYTNESNSVEILEYAIKNYDGPCSFPLFCNFVGYIEVFVYQSSSNGSSGITTEYQGAAGSLSVYANSTNPNVIVVGAVDKGLYNSQNGTTDIIKDYSCQGPNKTILLESDGVDGIDFVGPTGTATSTNSSFGGTSCATPNVAGTVAAFWSAHPYYSINGIMDILSKKSDIYKDWGSPNKDNIYGNGGVILYDYIANSKYLYKNSNNNNPVNTPYNFSPFLPYYNMIQAQYDMPNNGTVLIIGGDSFPQNGNIYGNTVNQGSGKKITYKTIGPSSSKFGF